MKACCWAAHIQLILALSISLPAFASEWPSPLSNAHLEVRRGLGTDGIAILPDLPYEATTLAQDELIEKIRKLEGDFRERAALIACDQIKRDPNAHPALRRWAALERITLLCYTNRAMQAVLEAEEWLLEHPDDPNALGIKYTAAQIIAQRGGPSEENRQYFWVLMTELLEEHADATSPVLVDAILFARGRVAYGGAPHPEQYYSELALPAVLRAEDAAREQGNTLVAELMERTREERIEPQLEPGYAQRRYEEHLQDPHVMREMAKAFIHMEDDGADLGANIEPHIREIMDEIRQEQAESGQ